MLRHQLYRVKAYCGWFGQWYMFASCKSRVQLFVNGGKEWPRSALRYHYLMPINCYFRDCQSAFNHEFASCM